ncbi:hypothetical protein RA210_U80183 [Rubrivivax sp. A210]|uniref:hypothetical protein n=1 Tax=Rubrivivax sp. A210 TaxID=2772301 RepID=UPI001917C744|nr:hypothetical protein [Rubrivivax sp. A210]CAD5375101.1 hypothetical protein RA210_U80183 [Rubrivivax sp. A210]
MNPPRNLVQKLGALAMLCFEGALRFGVASAAALAAILGQFALAVVLGLVALGIFLRLWRKRASGSRRGAGSG